MIQLRCPQPIYISHGCISGPPLPLCSPTSAFHLCLHLGLGVGVTSCTRGIGSRVERGSAPQPHHRHHVIGSSGKFVVLTVCGLVHRGILTFFSSYVQFTSQET